MQLKANLAHCLCKYKHCIFLGFFLISKCSYEKRNQGTIFYDISRKQGYLTAIFNCICKPFTQWPTVDYSVCFCRWNQNSNKAGWLACLLGHSIFIYTLVLLSVLRICCSPHVLIIPWRTTGECETFHKLQWHESYTRSVQGVPVWTQLWQSHYITLVLEGPMAQPFNLSRFCSHR